MLMGELMETIDVLSDPEMMKAIKQGQEDVKSGRVKDLPYILREQQES